MNWIMKSSNIKNNWSLILLAFSIVACQDADLKQDKIAALPYYNEATFTPNWLTRDAAELDTFHRIAPFQLLNQEGDTVTEKTFTNKIYITDFFFTICPGICPKMTKNMYALQEAFLEDEDVLLLSHSVTPERDSVPVLQAYAQNHGVNAEKWHLVTGTQQEIYELGRRQYFVEEDLGIEKDLEEFLHTENFVLMDKGRYIRGIYNGLNKASIRQLIEDVRTLQKEDQSYVLE